MRLIPAGQGWWLGLCKCWLVSQGCRSRCAWCGDTSSGDSTTPALLPHVTAATAAVWRESISSTGSGAAFWGCQVEESRETMTGVMTSALHVAEIVPIVSKFVSLICVISSLTACEKPVLRSWSMLVKKSNSTEIHPFGAKVCCELYLRIPVIIKDMVTHELIIVQLVHYATLYSRNNLQTRTGDCTTIASRLRFRVSQREDWTGKWTHYVFPRFFNIVTDVMIEVGLVSSVEAWWLKCYSRRRLSQCRCPWALLGHSTRPVGFQSRSLCEWLTSTLLSCTVPEWHTFGVKF